MTSFLKQILLFSYKEDEEIKKAFEIIKQSFPYYKIITKIDNEYIDKTYDLVIFLKTDKRDIQTNNKIYVIQYFKVTNYYELIELIREIIINEVSPVDSINFDIESALRENNSLIEEIKDSYVERKELEERLIKALENSNIVSVVSVLGYGGIGKTRLVKHILNQLKSKFISLSTINYK